MLAEDDYGIRTLQSMKLVGVGGAALATVTGDRLVAAGVNLLSRFGSAECGFLASSHRDYSFDKEWQYLRFGDVKEFVKFEGRHDDLAELLVKPTWPSKAKTNLNDGSYATSDLFSPHNSLPDTWMYHSRSDAQVVLSNGKKFDPSTTESDILASLPQLRDVYIFGDGRPQPEPNYCRRVDRG
ncbi:NRPS-like protein [Verticillium dahliae]